MQIAHDASTTSKYLTVSIGAAQFDGRETLEGLYRRADEVLYEAKAAGRNRVAAFDVGLDAAAVPVPRARPAVQRDAV